MSGLDFFNLFSALCGGRTRVTRVQGANAFARLREVRAGQVRGRLRTLPRWRCNPQRYRQPSVFLREQQPLGAALARTGSVPVTILPALGEPQQVR